jgi:hypothetical protein
VRVFALKAEFADFEAGGTTLPPNGETIDVGARLRDGVVIAHNEQEANALAGFHPLKELTGKAAEDARAAWEKAGANASGKTGAKGKSE